MTLTSVTLRLRSVPCKWLLLAALVLSPARPSCAQHYKQTNLVSDIAGLAAIQDPLLVNPWGMTFSPTSPFWVADNGSNFATLYAVDPGTGAVAKVPLNVALNGAPTGQVFDGTGDFVVSQGGNSGSAFFIFAALTGTVSGWNPGVNLTQAILAATGGPPPAVYTGLALAFRGADPFLYAANVAAGRVDVFDKTYAQVSVPGGFTDPNLPAGDTAFNVVNLNGALWVTFAGPTPVVDVFDTDGNFLRRFVTGGTLLNPWGVAVAPRHFGALSNALLIGNFNFGSPSVGPGWISAFDPITGSFRGLMEDTPGHPLTIDGLWTLLFGNGGSGGNPGVLYFSAGINGQADGLFGSLSWEPPGHRR